MIILGIESSCDETGVALYDTHKGLIGHDLYSQIATHAIYGGVVPELASRDHIRKCLPMVEQLLKQHNVTIAELGAVAYTAGPGLIGALLVGASFARGLAFSRNIPAIGVHHMEAHLLAPMLETERPEFPFLALLVSGGHTMLVEVDGISQYKLLGESLDDAAGEAFDKTAKILGLSYPGGPLLAALAEKGVPGKFEFTRPMVNRPGLDFSFSGLKTQVVHTLQKLTLNDQTRADIAYAFQETVVDTLAIKCERALKQTGLTRLIVAGGVSANKRLREVLQNKLGKKGVQIFYPSLAFCTDNGAMIALTAALRWQQGLLDGFIDMDVRPRWSLMELV